MNRNERLREVSSLRERAASLAVQVESRLRAGRSPDRLISLLREQLEVIDCIRSNLTELSTAESSESQAQTREEVERLKADFRGLVETAEENVRLASQKGVRLTGIGGRPHTPPRPKRG